MCSGCCEAKTYNKKEPINLYKFCRLYRSYNSPSGLAQCISAKLSNQCYQLYYDFKKVIDDEFGVDKINPGSYFSTVCYECNGCNEYCQHRIYDYSYPIPLAGASSSSVAASSSASAMAAVLARPGRPIY